MIALDAAARHVENGEARSPERGGIHPNDRRCPHPERLIARASSRLLWQWQSAGCAHRRVGLLISGACHRPARRVPVQLPGPEDRLVKANVRAALKPYAAKLSRTGIFGCAQQSCLSWRFES